MMKKLHNITPYLILLLLVIFVYSCVKTNTSTQIGPQFPSGTYTGLFRRVHQNLVKGTYDTLSANIILTLNTTTGFAVTGDTSTVHAGSYGAYILNSSSAGINTVQFIDKTYNPKITQTKVHLNGTYNYYFDGTAFQFLYTYSDTLSYQYILKSN